MGKSQKSTKKNLIQFFTVLSSVGFWGFLIFFINIQWSHVAVISNIYDDFEIRLDKPTYYDYYSVNDTFKITFILFNTWTQPLDAEFDIIKSEGITADYFCNTINEECPKSPGLSKEFLFKNLQQPQYITVKGIFNNGSGVAKVCLKVDEPGFHENTQQECVTYNPSGLKK